MSEFKVIADQLLDDFLNLVKIDSPSRKEREVADWLTARFTELGCTVSEDETGKLVKGNAGNLIVRYPGNSPDSGALLFSSHMDTVEPACGIEPVIEDGVIRSKGETVLGSDDKAGIAVILHLIRMANAQPEVPRPDLEFAIDVCEEIGLLGAKALDLSGFKAVAAYVLDDHDPRGVTMKSPSSARMDYKVIGRAAHAGVEPEKGISALKVSAEAISKMKMGRIDEVTTCNIGAIEGGKMSNIVMESVTMKGEARSHDPQKLSDLIEHMDNCFIEACNNWRKEGEELPKVEIKRQDDYSAVQLTEEDYPVKLVIESGKKLGWNVEAKISGGGSDANIIHHKGIPTAVLGVGMQNVHSTSEYIRISDLEDAARLAGSILVTHVKGI